MKQKLYRHIVTFKDDMTSEYYSTSSNIAGHYILGKEKMIMFRDIKYGCVVLNPDVVALIVSKEIEDENVE